MSLARYASDRGDAERGLALLRRAGLPPDHELVQLLEHFQPAPRPDIGRNQPCWCGSGRKYKVCHLHREQLPLAERAAWLYQKAGADLLEGPFGPLLIETAQARARYWDSPGRARAGARRRSGLRRGAVRGRRVRRVPCRARRVAARGRAVAGRAVAAGASVRCTRWFPFGAATE